MEKFTIYWRDGKREVIEGNSISEAFAAAGYSNGAVNAIDWYENGEQDQHTWNPVTRQWERNESLL